MLTELPLFTKTYNKPFATRWKKPTEPAGLRKMHGEKEIGSGLTCVMQNGSIIEKAESIFPVYAVFYREYGKIFG